MARKLADRMSRLGTETAFEVLVKAKALEAQGRDIVHLEIGEPDFDTPAHVTAAAKQALDDGYTHYGPSPGQPPLREAIADYLNRTRKTDYTADNVCVVSGGKPIIFYTALALLEAGDEAIWPDPGFPIYESVINFAGATPISLPLKEERNFCFSVDDLQARISDRTKLLILNSPQNPTGGVLTRDDLEAIAALAIKHDFWVLSDEIYDQILYDDFQFASIASCPGMTERTIILNGFSKSYAMTGWRVGYGAMPTDLLPHIARLMTNSDSCTASFSQIACVQALQGDHAPTRTMVAEFKKRRDVIVAGLNAIKGITCKKPLGAFYAFANVTSLGRDSAWLADYFLNEAGVACLDGKCFGPAGDGYVRFSFANSVANIEKALARLAEAIAKL